MSGEITAIATAVLAAFAFITAILAGAAFIKQSREVRAIERQVKDQEEITKQQAGLLEVQSGQLELQRQQFADQLAERRRAQASRVFIWIKRGWDPSDQGSGTRPSRSGMTVYIRNTSEQPIYELTVDWGPEKPPWIENEYLGILMPGGQVDAFQPWPEVTVDLTKDLFPPELAPIAGFRDAAGLHWLLTTDGGLEQDENPREQG